MIKTQTALLVGGAALLVIGVSYITQRMSKSGAAAGLGASVGVAAVGAVVGAGVGAVKAVGDAVGIPDTDISQCRADMAAGRTWDASFSCPLPVFARYVAGMHPEPIEHEIAPMFGIVPNEQKSWD